MGETRQKSKFFIDLIVFLAIFIVLFFIFLLMFPDRINITGYISKEATPKNIERPQEPIIKEVEQEKILDNSIEDEAIVWNMPIKFYINASDLYEELRKQKTKNFKIAITRLTKAVPSITFEEVNISDEADIIFGVNLPKEYWNLSDAGKNKNPFGDSSTIATGLMVPDNNENTKVKAYVYDTSENKCQDSNTALHELLHAFGIGHYSADFGSLMSPESGWGCASDSQRSIEPENIGYLKSIYGF